MTDPLENALAATRGRPELARLRRGIEKESLRTDPNGALSARPHPRALGAPLTHPHITTDFSEAQLELITGVHDGAEAVLEELADIHRFVYRGIGDELLWPASMPCALGPEHEIPVARFGTSNVGRSKTIYRRGLAHRYGRLMQTVSGIHYNFSVPEALWPAIAKSRGESADQDFVTRAYFGLIRNFRRHSWLLLYLFGASPAVSTSFIGGREARLSALDEGTLYLPGATSLRMGRLGYQSEAQASLHISYNDLSQYATTMRRALTQPYPPYAAIGTKVDGEYRQLSTALLQIENEFYGAIRPKRSTAPGERPLDALEDRGVEYVEVRCLDLDPFLPLGIDVDACRFLDVFLLFCLLADSPPDHPAETEAMLANQRAVVERGREPGLALASPDGSLALRAWALDLLGACRAVAEAIDAVAGGDGHVRAHDAQVGKVESPASTPSARLLQALQDGDESFFRFAMKRSLAHRRTFARDAERPGRQTELAAMSKASIAEQARLEAVDGESFDDYLSRFLTLGGRSAGA